RLHDLVVDETRKLCAALTEANFPQDTPFDKGEMHSRARRLEALSEILLAIVAPSVFWGPPYVIDWVTKSIQRIANAWQTRAGTIFPQWERLQKYPRFLVTF